MLDSSSSSPGYSPPEVVAAVSFVEMLTVALSAQINVNGTFKVMLAIIRGSRNTVGGFILWRYAPTWQATIGLYAVMNHGALASCTCSDCNGLGTIYFCPFSILAYCVSFIPDKLIVFYMIQVVC